MDTPASVKKPSIKTGQAFILDLKQEAFDDNSIQEKDTYCTQWNSTPAMPSGSPARQHHSTSLSAKLCRGENYNGI